MIHVAGRVAGSLILAGVWSLLGGCSGAEAESASLLFVQNASGLTCSGETIPPSG